MRRVSIVFIPLLLCACGAQTAWVRPGASLVQVQEDQRQCSSLAWRQAQSDYWWDDAYLAGGPIYPHDRYWLMRQQQAQLSAQMHEQRLRDFCMRARGYELETLPPKN